MNDETIGGQELSVRRKSNVPERTFSDMMKPKDDSRLSELVILSQAFALSRYFKDLDTQNMMVGASQALVKILRGQGLNFSPAESVENIYVIDGKTCISSQSMLSLIRRNGGTIDIWENTERECSVTFYYDKEKIDTAGLVRYTIKDAEVAGLTVKPNWKKYPKNMLFWRCISTGFRQYFSHLAMGSLYTPNELGYSIIDGQVIREEEGHVSDLKRLEEEMAMEVDRPEVMSISEADMERGQDEGDAHTGELKTDWSLLSRDERIRAIYPDGDISVILNLIYQLTNGSQYFALEDIKEDDGALLDLYLGRLQRVMGAKSTIDRVRRAIKYSVAEIDPRRAISTSYVDGVLSEFVQSEKDNG